ncbi:MAG: hypothetical protein MHM6MM_000941 [Cercozoa sp. M6MM]
MPELRALLTAAGQQLQQDPKNERIGRMLSRVRRDAASNEIANYNQEERMMAAQFVFSYHQLVVMAPDQLNADAFENALAKSVSDMDIVLRLLQDVRANVPADKRNPQNEEFMMSTMLLLETVARCEDGAKISEVIDSVTKDLDVSSLPPQVQLGFLVSLMTLGRWDECAKLVVLPPLLYPYLYPYPSPYFYPCPTLSLTPMLCEQGVEMKDFLHMMMMMQQVQRAPVPLPNPQALLRVLCGVEMEGAPLLMEPIGLGAEDVLAPETLKYGSYEIERIAMRLVSVDCGEDTEKAKVLTDAILEEQKPGEVWTDAELPDEQMLQQLRQQVGPSVPERVLREQVRVCVKLTGGIAQMQSVSDLPMTLHGSILPKGSKGAEDAARIVLNGDTMNPVPKEEAMQAGKTPEQWTPDDLDYVQQVECYDITQMSEDKLTEEADESFRTAATEGRVFEGPYTLLHRKMDFDLQGSQQLGLPILLPSEDAAMVKMNFMVRVVFKCAPEDIPQHSFLFDDDLGAEKKKKKSKKSKKSKKHKKAAPADVAVDLENLAL